MSSAVSKADFASTVVNPNIGSGIGGLDLITLGEIYHILGMSNAGIVEKSRKLIDEMTLGSPTFDSNLTAFKVETTR
jgi:hypothetical protein